MTLKACFFKKKAYGVQEPVKEILLKLMPLSTRARHPCRRSQEDMGGNNSMNIHMGSKRSRANATIVGSMATLPRTVGNPRDNLNSATMQRRSMFVL